jgi:hypothetical protein
MGGPGSGNRNRFDSKTLAERCLFVDVRQLSRTGCLEPWLRYSWKWNNGCNIVIETKPEAIELLYTISYDGQQREDVHIRVPLSWTPCNYGGKRPWFICPGKDCGRRVAKLYLEGKYFLCRHCHDLVYSSQGVGKEWRLMDKAQRIYKRLGVNSHDDIYFKPKPKGMHQATYDMLSDKALDLEHEAMQAVIRKIKSI